VGPGVDPPTHTGSPCERTGGLARTFSSRLMNGRPDSENQRPRSRGSAVPGWDDGT
jgi:hypothetical protein